MQLLSVRPGRSLPRISFLPSAVIFHTLYLIAIVNPVLISAHKMHVIRVMSFFTQRTLKYVEWGRKLDLATLFMSVLVCTCLFLCPVYVSVTYGARQDRWYGPNLKFNWPLLVPPQPESELCQSGSGISCDRTSVWVDRPMCRSHKHHLFPSNTSSPCQKRKWHSNIL